MRGAVETVAAHLVVFVVFVGDGVGVGHGRHGLVEGGVKDGNLRDFVAQSGLAGVGMPMMLPDCGGGARGLQVSMACMTLSSMRTEEAKASPPWTTRWPVDLAHGGDDAVGRVYQGR